MGTFLESITSLITDNLLQNLEGILIYIAPIVITFLVAFWVFSFVYRNVLKSGNDFLESEAKRKGYKNFDEMSKSKGWDDL